MPEAVKEVVAEVPQIAVNDELISEAVTKKDAKPAEASSGTLPSDEVVASAEGGEGEVAPDLGQGDAPEEGKSVPSQEKSESAGENKDSSGASETKEQEKSEGILPESNDKVAVENKGDDSKVHSEEATPAERTQPPAGSPEEAKNLGDESQAKPGEESQSGESSKQEASPAECESEESKQASPEESKTEEALEVVQGEDKPSKAEEEKSDENEDKLKVSSSMEIEVEPEKAVSAETKEEKPRENSTSEEPKVGAGGDVPVGKEGSLLEPANTNGESNANEAVPTADSPMEVGDANGEPRSKTGEVVSGAKEDSSKESASTNGKSKATKIISTAEKGDIPKEVSGANGEPKSKSEEKEGSPMEASSTEAGNSREIDPKAVQEFEKLFREGKAALMTGDHFTAADILGKCCEEARNLYGELADENAELYFLYGCAMLDCAKNENPVLGEKLENKEEDEDEESEEENGDVDEDEKVDSKIENGTAETEEAMAVDEIPETEEVTGEEKEARLNGGAEENGEESTKENGEENETIKENEEEEDTSLKVSWEMFELAKLIYTRMGNEKKLADTYMKLGEVGVESGHQAAMDDMKTALELRVKSYGNDSRIIAESYFNLGLAYSSFQMFDEAIECFGKSKSLLENRITSLSKIETTEAADEVKEIKELLPDLDEKIQDMKESKEEKAKKDALEKLNGESSSIPLVEESSSSKPVTNISHLVKRKRKLEDVASDLLPESKQVCTEKVAEPGPAAPASSDLNN